MAGIATAPCTWPLADGMPCPELDDLDYGLDDEIREAATAYLWNWTRKTFGLCEVTVRPCRTDCDGSTYRGRAGVAHASRTSFGVELVAGEWRNLACGDCGGGACSCEAVSSVRLPGPVHEILEVTVDGEVVPASAYRVDDRTTLVRDDGGTWPVCQDLSEPADADGTWQVTYTWGVPVPAGGKVAAAALACEMAKALRQSEDCQLPERVQTVTREGVTLAILDAFEGLEAGRTGVWLVDSWVASVTESPSRSKVHAIGGRAPRVTTYRGS